jgi:large subunit ribosomal protein L32
MPKHPVPKKKHSRTRSKQRYHTYENEAQKRLTKNLTLVACSNCTEMRRAHHVCESCGMYRGRQVIDMEKKMKKVTTIKA